MSQIRVTNILGAPIPLINIRLSLGEESSDQAYDDRFTDLVGATAWPNPLSSDNGYTLYVNYSNATLAYEKTLIHVDDFDEDIEIVLPYTYPSKLRIHNKKLFNMYGEILLRGNTDFLLYKKYLDGEDIEPLLIERKSYGSMYVRIFGMCKIISDFNPAKYPDYYSKIVSFCQLLGKYGLYVYWTVFADTQLIMPGLSTQVTHFDKVVKELEKVTNTYLELVNEPYAHDNATDDPFAFDEPQNLVASSGSYNDKYGNKPTPQPRWSLHDFHTPRSYPKMVADQNMSVNPNYIIGQAVKSGEPDGYGIGYDTKLDQIKEMSGAITGTGCDICYHTTSGKRSLPWTGEEKKGAVVFFSYHA